MAYYLNEKKRRLAYHNGEKIAIVTAIEGNKILTAPTITLNGDILTITPTDSKTETLAVFVDGKEIANVSW